MKKIKFIHKKYVTTQVQKNRHKGTEVVTPHK